MSKINTKFQAKPFPILSNNSIRSFTIEHAECWRLNLLNASLCLSLDNWNKLTQGLSPSGMIWPALTLKPARWDSSFHLVYIPPNIFQQCRGQDNKEHLHNIYVILSCPLSVQDNLRSIGDLVSQSLIVLQVLIWRRIWNNLSPRLK